MLKKVSYIFYIGLIVLFTNACKTLAQSNKNAEVKSKQFKPGLPWLDNHGIPINAHGGGVIFYNGIYYWYGEHKLPGKSELEMADGGIHCYSSKDLLNWKDEGLVLSVKYDDSKSDIAYGCILERPKVIYNSQTKKFNAFFKLYPKGTGYLKGYIGVATADKPNGPFIYQHKFLGADSDFGSGDFAMFKDQDNTVYHFTVRKPDKTFVIGKLEDDYLFARSKSYFLAKGIEPHTEAPALISRNGKYYLIGSGSSSWDPNAARSFVADSVNGLYTDTGNPTSGINPYNNLGAEKTFGGQISYIIPVQGKKDAYIAMFDVWKPNEPINGLYIWLPLTFKDGKPEIVWKDKWDLSFFK
ncbi:family 43 glycosylhydrolase [Pedobacter sp. SD-b]|uniref:Family 43 glycosylhydrolase n=1 Tax=Pedobacter segetis TaxID=2793069 RepID=A0ABS1BL92_9SPHI|nr:family 43 glycosylhydrolase [Pedobacter segetis]MBK0383573.1 family 43 glycosylhydrolase [Pedobacter segetis]